ncbi:hypothetical protein SESBI_43127 [Sesbania bispinosa]|nr:hypothetical protein SESBI_43127 [Sesbania bispinosa]
MALPIYVGRAILNRTMRVCEAFYMSASMSLIVANVRWVQVGWGGRRRREGRLAVDLEADERLVVPSHGGGWRRPLPTFIL